MNFEYYNPVDEKGSCVQRSISKVLNKDYFEVKNDLINIANNLNIDNFREVEVFEKYLYQNNFKDLDIKDILVKDLKLESGRYIVFCHEGDKYHMIPIINNTVYDKTREQDNGSPCFLVTDNRIKFKFN